VAWQFNGTAPVFVQIADRIRGRIVRGDYPPDGQIPPVRQLAVEAAVNPNTMQRALTLLEEEGLIQTRGTVGRFVTPDADSISRARESVFRETAQESLRHALACGMTREELIHYLTKEGTE